MRCEGTSDIRNETLLHTIEHLVEAETEAGSAESRAFPVPSEAKLADGVSGSSSTVPERFLIATSASQGEDWPHVGALLFSLTPVLCVLPIVARGVGFVVGSLRLQRSSESERVSCCPGQLAAQHPPTAWLPALSATGTAVP